MKALHRKNPRNQKSVWALYLNVSEIDIMGQSVSIDTLSS